MDEELQNEEIQVLQAIYPDCISSDETGYHLSIPVEMASKEVYVGGELSATFAYLPPVLLDFILPETYPRSRRPEISLIQAACDWLNENQLHRLKTQLVEMWTGEGVLYTWVEHIRTGEFLSALEIEINGVIR